MTTPLSSTFQAATGGSNSSNGPGIVDHHRELDHLGIGITLRRNSYNSSDDLFAKIGYKISVVRNGGSSIKSSDKTEEVLPAGSPSASWSPRSRLHELYTKPKFETPILPKAGGYVRVRVDLFYAHPLTEVVLCPCGGSGNNNGSSGSIILG